MRKNRRKPPNFYCHCEAGFARRGNLLSVGSCVCQNFLSLRASPQTGVAISCRLVPASIIIPCHCEPVRRLAWQSVLLLKRFCECNTDRGNGLPRHFVARNDSGLESLLRRKRYPLRYLQVQFLRRVSFLFRQERYQRSRLGRV